MEGWQVLSSFSEIKAKEVPMPSHHSGRRRAKSAEPPCPTYVSMSERSNRLCPEFVTNPVRHFALSAIKDGQCTGCDLWGVNLEDADLSSANLRGANLKDSDLRNATLTNADLVGANLSNSDLRGTVFFGADLSNANLKGAHILGTKFNGAILCNTTMPDGHVEYSGCAVTRIEDALKKITELLKRK